MPRGLLPIAVLAVAVAGLAAHSRLLAPKLSRTILSGNVFEDTRNQTGQGFVYSVVRDATGQEAGLYQAVVRAGAAGAIPGLSGSPPRHYHTVQTECFTVKQGVFGFHINGSEGAIEADSSVAAQPTCIPPGVVHYFWNARNNTDLKIDVTLTPPGTAAGSSVDFFRTLIGFGLDLGGLGNAGLPQVLTTFVGGGVTLVDFSPRAWWVIEHVLVPFVFVPVLGIEPFPAEYIAH